MKKSCTGWNVSVKCHCVSEMTQFIIFQCGSNSACGNNLVFLLLCGKRRCFITRVLLEMNQLHCWYLNENTLKSKKQGRRLFSTIFCYQSLHQCYLTFFRMAYICKIPTIWLFIMKYVPWLMDQVFPKMYKWSLFSFVLIIY